MLKPHEIGKVRKRLNLTQAQLAKLSNVSQSLIAKIESGRIDPSFSKASALSETLLRLQRRNSLKTKDIMTQDVIHISSVETVEQAAKLMNGKAISQIPIYHDSRQVGSLSEKTILRLLSEGKKPASMFGKHVKEVMDDPFPTVTEDTPIELLYSLLDFVQAVMVMRREKIVGIVSKADLLKLG